MAQHHIEEFVDLVVKHARPDHSTNDSRAHSRARSLSLSLSLPGRGTESGSLDSTEVADMTRDHLARLAQTRIKHSAMITALTEQEAEKRTEADALIKVGFALDDHYADDFEDHQMYLYELAVADDRATSDGVLLASRIKRIRELEETCASQRRHIADAASILQEEEEGVEGCEGGCSEAVNKKRLLVAHRSDMWWKSKFKAEQAVKRDTEARTRAFCVAASRPTTCPICMDPATVRMDCCGIGSCAPCLVGGGASCPHCKAPSLRATVIVTPNDKPGSAALPLCVGLE